MKRMLLSLAILLLAITANAGEEDITLNTPTGDIHGRLMLPEGKAPCPVVIIIAGSGPTDMNGNSIGLELTNNALLYLAEELAANGIASMRYDKRGIGRSAKAAPSEEELRFEHYINDATMWADKLGNDARFNSVIIAGHSEGSLIGMIAAQQSKAVKGYISIAGCGSPANKILEKQLQNHAEWIRKDMMAILNELCEERTVDNVPFYTESLFRPSVQPYLISWFRYNPTKEIAKLDMPVLILQGDRDMQVGVEEAEKLYAAKQDATYYIIRDMNHVLKQCSTDNIIDQIKIYNNPDLPIKTELVTYIVEFIK